MRRRGARYCRNCETKVTATADRCGSCGGVALYRGTNPRRQSLRGLMDHLPEREEPPAETSYGTPVRHKRGFKGHGPQ